MGRSLADVDGVIVPVEEAFVPITDPGLLLGWTVFETLSTVAGEVALLDAHLDRLQDSAAAACLPSFDRGHLAGRARALAAAHGGHGRLRITLTGGGRCLLAVEDVEPSRRCRPVRAVTGHHVDDPVLGGSVKHGSRAPWVVAVRRAGVDEVLLVDEHGCFTEGTTCAILAVQDGVLWTAPWDGRILASTTTGALLARADRLGIPVRREAPSASGPWTGLYIASATRWLAPVVSLDGRELPGWEPVGRLLAGVDGVEGA